MTELFRGFVKTRNKKCTQKFANGEPLLTLEQVQKYDEYAGILAENTILIDIDNLDQSEVLMNIIEDRQINCRVIQTTRGRHFYFKNTKVTTCATHTHLACGLTADIKIGSKNSYAILKFDGEERFLRFFCLSRLMLTFGKWTRETGETKSCSVTFLPCRSTDCRRKRYGTRCE